MNPDDKPVPPYEPTPENEALLRAAQVEELRAQLSALVEDRPRDDARKHVDVEAAQQQAEFARRMRETMARAASAMLVEPTLVMAESHAMPLTAPFSEILGPDTIVDIGQPFTLNIRQPQPGDRPVRMSVELEYAAPELRVATCFSCGAPTRLRCTYLVVRAVPGDIEQHVCGEAMCHEHRVRPSLENDGQCLRHYAPLTPAAVSPPVEAMTIRQWSQEELEERHQRRGFLKEIGVDIPTRIEKLAAEVGASGLPEHEALFTLLAAEVRGILGCMRSTAVTLGAQPDQVYVDGGTERLWEVDALNVMAMQVARERMLAIHALHRIVERADHPSNRVDYDGHAVRAIRAIARDALTGDLGQDGEAQEVDPMPRQFTIERIDR